LRLGYVLAPDADGAARLRRRRPQWSVGSLALAVLPDLLDRADLPDWSRRLAHGRRDLVALLDGHGLTVSAHDAPWALVSGIAGLRERLARRGVLVRDCTSFGLAGTVRIAVPSPADLERLAIALDRTEGCS
jgi:histidinol-phosphate/aromatic aminotransferase/cobyric acid decarboxylase-like protein